MAAEMNQSPALSQEINTPVVCCSVVVWTRIVVSLVGLVRSDQERYSWWRWLRWLVGKQPDRTKNSLGQEKMHKNLSGKWSGGVRVLAVASADFAADETDYRNYRQKRCWRMMMWLENIRRMCNFPLQSLILIWSLSAILAATTGSVGGALSSKVTWRAEQVHNMEWTQNSRQWQQEHKVWEKVNRLLIWKWTM